MFKSRATRLWCVLACTRRVSLSTSVEMIGDGDLGEVVIEAKVKNVVVFRAAMGRVAKPYLAAEGRRRSLVWDRHQVAILTAKLAHAWLFTTEPILDCSATASTMGSIPVS